MREWVATTSSPKGRLALTAVRAFGGRRFEDVTVGELASGAGVTTGALYHHFESKLGLYVFVRRDVERRLLDRMEGAAEASADPLAALRSALLVGFDFAVGKDFTRLLGQPPPDATDGLERFLTQLPLSEPLGRILAAAWRAALLSVADGVPTPEAREALASLSVGQGER